MKTSANGIALIQSFEGCRLKSYRDSAGILTIGWGTTEAAGLGPVVAGMTITQEQADTMFVISLAPYEAAVMKALTRSPNQNQFDAMVSLVYNIGPNAFKGSSVVKRFNAGMTAPAAAAFRMWTKATVGGEKITLGGLVARRDAEAKLFLTPVEAPRKPVEAHPPVLAPDTPDEQETPSVRLEKAPGSVWDWLAGFWR